MKKNKPFFNTLNQIMDEMASNVKRPLSDNDLTISKVYLDLKQRGLVVSISKARFLIKDMEKAGKIRPVQPDGKRIDVMTGKWVRAWEVVNPSLKHAGQ